MLHNCNNKKNEATNYFFQNQRKFFWYIYSRLQLSTVLEGNSGHTYLRTPFFNRTLLMAASDDSSDLSVLLE